MVRPLVRRCGGEVIISGISPFDLEETLTSGQAFRWTGCGTFTGVVRGRVIKVRQKGASLVLEAPVDDEGVQMVTEYFALDTDHAEIERLLCEKDDALKCAVGFAPGLRLLRQEPWECLVTFILSAHNAIPLIQRTVERIAGAYGDPIPSSDPECAGDAHFGFPTPDQLARPGVAGIAGCGAGFRAPYVREAAERIASGSFDLPGLGKLAYADAKERLMELRGVGKKIADCVLLFSLGFYQAFPIDIWMTRVMRYFYFDGKKVPISTIAEFAGQRFGDLAGYAQQYLFHYARKKLASEIRGLE